MKHLTEKELLVANLFANTSLDCCGGFSADENMSCVNAKDIADETGLSLQAVGGVMSQLEQKSLIGDAGESYRGAKINDFYGNPEVFLTFPQVSALVR